MFFEKEKTSILNNVNNRILQFATMSFDVSYQEIYSALIFGNTLVLIDDILRKDMSKLSDYIINKRINTLFIPPAYLKLLVEDSNIVHKLSTSIKNIITAGEALVITSGMRALLNNGIKIHNHYGPAETHVATTYTIDKNNVSLTPPIGQPIANTNIHILDNEHNLCPIGVIGEIAISGDCVGNGYINNNDLTKQKFLINKYNNQKMYLTGDLGYYDYNGIVNYVGRSDFQVKINGFRIELGEIDHCLNSMNEIGSAISIIHEENEKKYIITYYTTKEPIDEKVIQKHLKSALPFYMQPKKIIMLDKLPININGKIDRKKLPNINLSDVQDKYVEPTTDTEVILSEICKQLFKTNKIGTTANFFNIGGDSLLAIKYVSLINSKLNVEVEVSEIYDNASIYELALLIDKKKKNKYSKIAKVAKKPLYNVSSAQKRIYNATKIDGENSILYNMPGVIIFDNKPDVQKLNKCFNMLIERHSSLRTSFEVHNLKIYQKIADKLSFKLETSKVEEENINNILKDFIKPFNLEKAPLLRAKLVFTKSNKSLLLFDMHHIISDGFSINILSKELNALYNSEALIPLPIEYKDYSEWEFKQLSEKKLEKSKDYWVNQFKKDIPLLNMPTDYTRPAVQTYEGAKIHSVISEDLFKKINLLSNKLAVSNNMILLACYFILLSKYTDQEDIIVGSPIAGRTREEVLSILGVFINTLPLKVRVQNNASFTNFIEKVKEISLLAIQNQEYPFDELVYNLSLDRDTSRNPLFDTMFIYQSNGYPSLNFNGLKSELVIPDSNISKYDLTLEVIPTASNYKLSFEYATSLFTKETIESLLEHFINIVSEVVSNPDIKLSNINMLSLFETNKILNDFNNTKRPYPNQKSYIDLFNKQVKNNPNKTALVFHGQKVSYDELNKKSNQIANYLIKKGIKNNDFVGLLVNRSFELIVAIIGILKAGAAYIPIDPSYPLARINYMIKDSNIKVILSQKNIIETLNIENAIDIDFSNSIIYKSYSDKAPNLIILPENYAYLIYTSGSTGNPKGVIISHKNINNFIAGMTNKIDLSNINNVLSITTVSFDIFGLEILLPLQKGLTIVLADEEEQTNQQKLNALCMKNNVDIIQTTPSKFELLIQNSEDLDYIKHMDSILLGGEPFPLRLLKKLKSITNAKIYNVYGPTETTIWSSVKDLTNNNTITIGTPISNTYMYVLDKNMNLLPPGIPGNLYIGGDSVSIGYHNNSKLTTQKFVDNPFIDNDRIYNTGDLAKWLPSGEIECLGRDDFQVKLHGLRIELGEIESSILGFPNISNCVVCLKSINPERPMLCAYIISKEQINTSNLKDYLSNILPVYMIPTYIVQIESLTYTPNGKIDRNALPLPDMSSSLNNRNIEPQTYTEIELSKLLINVLNISSISVSDNLFNLGIDSLSAIILCTKIRQKFSVDITFKDIVNNSTIRLLAQKIDNTKSTEKLPIIPKYNTMEYYPISSAQKRIYLASNMDNEKKSTLYNIAGGVLFDESIDIQKIENVFALIIKRHEILRTYFEVIEGNIVQKILPSLKVKIDIIKSNTNDIASLLKKYMYTFDLNKAPLFKLTLFQLPNSKEFLMLDVHHIIFDGTSLKNLLKEFSALYNNKILPDLYISYKDFAIWENKQISNNLFKESKEYWINQFKSYDIPVLDMPTTYPRPAEKSYEGNTYITEMSKDITKKINNLSSKYNCTPYMFMLCIYYILLYKYTNQEDIIVGSPVSGRLYNELQPLFGVFVNSLPLKNTITPNITFDELLESVKNTCVNAFAHQDYPLDILINDLNISRDSSRSPLFDTMFAYQNIDNINIKIDEKKSKVIVAKSNTSKFDITLEIVPKDGFLKLSYEYCTKLFDESFIKQFAKHYENILLYILDMPKCKISDISILDIDEKNQILLEFNNKKLNYSNEKTIIELFDEQVKKHPNNIAVSIDNIKYTYKELNKKANSLAIQLIKQNIKSKDVVGVLLTRSVELIVSILAILKCNATYMPLSSSYPEDRLNYMIKNSKSKLIITNTNLKKKITNTNYYILDSIKHLHNVKKSIDTKYGNSSDIAYIIYTSGSTGRPKGVQITNNNLNNFINNFNKYFKNVTSEDRFLSSTNISFDVSIFEIFMPLLNGSTLVLYHDELIKDIIDYCNYIVENKITALYIPPNILNEVYYVLKDKENISINKLLVGVEAIKKKTLNKYFSLNPNMRIINGYGPSETTICCTALNYIQDTNSIEEVVSIGKPLYNNNIYILGNDMQMLPIGVIGELYITGDGVGSGYIYNNDETSKNFIDNTYDNLSEKMYKTGDLGKWNTDGTISLIGRKDSQVKISGYRIELKEIDNVIMQYPDIEKSISIVIDYENKKRISSYYVGSRDISNIELKSYLSKKLPFYMVPSDITQLKAFPITSNGKIDTKQLPKSLLYNTISEKSNYIAPSNNLERQIAEIFENLLSISPIGIDDNFFKLGGDSLLAINLQIELLKKKINVTYSDIFMNPTVRELCNKIASNSFNATNVLDNNDFLILNSILKNTCTMPNKIIPNNIGNILLTGVTGFLGSHILDAYLTHESGIIYCLMRPSKQLTLQEKLIKKLHYYFGNKYDTYIGTRIIIIESDITKSNLGLSPLDIEALASDVSCIINCAAKVTHYGDYNSYKEINVDATENLLQFALKNNKRFYQISTLSVSGIALEQPSNIAQDFENDVFYKENNFFINQSLDNVYVRSKFEAEKKVLQYISKGLDAYILRVGNLMNRYSDGKFQPNVEQNAYINRLMSLANIGYIPNYLLNNYLEFTPIDSCALAVIKLIQNPNSNNRVFHLYNHNHVYVSEFIDFMKKYINVKIVSNKRFINKIDKLLTQNNSDKLLSGILRDFDKNRHLAYDSKIKVTSYFTINYLLKIGFIWPKIDQKYLKQFLDYYSDLGLLKKKGE